MSRKLQLWRGLEAGISTLAAGEPGFCTDSYKLFIGSGAGNREIYPRGIVSVEDYGAKGDGTDDGPAINLAIIAAAGGPIEFQRNRTYTVSTAITNAITGTIFRGNGATLKLAATNTLLLRTIDVDSFLMENLKIDLNHVANAIGIHQLGGWHCCYRNIISDKNGVDTSSYDFRIESTAAGSGSHGSYVNRLEGCVFQRVWIKGAATNHVTTFTTINLDSSYIIGNYADALMFIQPIIQEDGGYHFDLDTVDGLTCLGGDFEGSGTLYYLRASCQHIKSIGNTMAGFSGTYLTIAPAGNDPANSIFQDNTTINPYRNLILQSLSGQAFRNTGWNILARQGFFYSGDVYQICFNCTPISATQVNLDDTGYPAFVMSLKAAGATLETATAGTNPRNLSSATWS